MTESKDTAAFSMHGSFIRFVKRAAVPDNNPRNAQEKEKIDASEQAAKEKNKPGNMGLCYRNIRRCSDNRFYIRLVHIIPVWQ
jgi:hypothetical protein